MNSSFHATGVELRRSLNFVILGITFGMAFFVIVNGTPLTGFTRALGAGDFVYSIIMAMPVIGSVFQVFASYFLENTGRRKFIFLLFGFIHRLLWIPIAIIPLVVPMNYSIIRIWAFIVLLSVSSVANSIVGVSFMSWMGALVPMDIRGRFFSKRTMICTISSAIAGMAAGRLLDKIPDFKGFAIVFITAALLGLADILCFIWVKDPPMELPKERIPFLKLFVEPFSNRNYVRFILFISVWNFGVNFVGPFFNVYMIEDLKMSYFTITIFTQVCSNFFTVISIRYWGRIVDKFGNKPVLSICCSLVIILPALWCFTTPENYIIIVFITSIGGILWPGIDLTVTNLSIWLAPEKNRSIYVANYSLIVSLVGIALAFVCGGAFLEFTKPFLNHLNFTFVMGQKFNSFHVLFIMSSLIRLLALLIFLPRIEEENSLTAGETLGVFINSMKVKTKKSGDSSQ